MDWLMPATSLSLFNPKMAEKLPFLAQNRDFWAILELPLLPGPLPKGVLTAINPRMNRKNTKF